MKIVKVKILDGEDEIGFTDWGEYFQEKKTAKLEDVRWKRTPRLMSKLSVTGNNPDGSVFAHDMTLTHQTNNFANCWFN